MRQAKVYVHNSFAGLLTEHDKKHFSFTYDESYKGPPVSLTMPVAKKTFSYNVFPPFFDGLLPEGTMLESLLRQAKLDKHDYFGQLLVVGEDLVGAVSVKELKA